MANSSICLLPDRGVIEVRGPEARAFLQGLITNDMGIVSASRAIFAALLTPQGKYLFDFFVAQSGYDSSCRFLLDCEAARSAGLVKRLTFYKLRSKLLISDLSDIMGVAAYLGRNGLQPAGLTDQPGAAIQWADGVAFTDPRMPGMGARVIAQKSALTGLDAGASADDYDRLRLQFGLTDGARDILVEKYFLLEANFEELNGVDFNKGCYVGQELVSRMKHRNAVRKRIVPVSANGPLAAAGTPILQAGREVGTLLSGRGRHALAYLRLAALAQNTAPLIANGVELAPQIPAWLSGKLTPGAADTDDEN